MYLTQPSPQKANTADRISIYTIQDNLIFNKDGSISVGFEVILPEEEYLDEDAYRQIIDEFSRSLKTLPVNTTIQKTDIFNEEKFEVPINDEMPFFHRNTLKYHNGKQKIRPKTYLHITFFEKECSPLGILKITGIYNKLKKLKIKKRDVNFVEGKIKEFIYSLPSFLKLRRLDDQENKNLIYQYLGMQFHRNQIDIENSIEYDNDNLWAGKNIKVLSMKDTMETISYTKKNDFGLNGVTSPLMWNFSHYLRFGHVVTQRIRIIDDKKFRKKKYKELDYCASLQLNNLSRTSHLAQNNLGNLLELEKYIEEENLQIVAMDFNIFVYHHSEDILDNRLNEIKSNFSKNGISLMGDKENTFDIFFSNLPGGGNGFWEKIYQPMQTAVSHLNFSSPQRGDKEGILLKNRHGDPIYYDPFKNRLDNQHAFVFGPTGSGKSFFNGKMIKDRYFLGHTVMVIDSGGTYRNLFKALKGKYIEYDPQIPLKLNPFLTKKTKEKHTLDTHKVSFLINFLSKIWKGDLTKYPINEVEYSILSEFLETYYENLKTSEIPSLIGFNKYLKQNTENLDIDDNQFRLKDFLRALNPFTKGMYKDVFNSDTLEYFDEERLICFELQTIKTNEKLYPLVVQVLFDFVFQIVENQPDQKKFIDVEEGWTMLDDSSKDYIESFYRKGRKTNTSIRMITQNVDEIRDSKIAGAMKNNAATFILLYNNNESVRNDISDFLGMTEFDMEKYASLRRRDNFEDGYREVFIKEMDKSSVWRIDASPHEHAILTSMADERNMFNKLVKENEKRIGYFNIEIATSTWIENKLKSRS